MITLIDALETTISQALYAKPNPACRKAWAIVRHRLSRSSRAACFRVGWNAAIITALMDRKERIK